MFKNENSLENLNKYYELRRMITNPLLMITSATRTVIAWQISYWHRSDVRAFWTNVNSYALYLLILTFSFYSNRIFFP